MSVGRTDKEPEDESAALDEQQALLECSLQAVFSAYDEAAGKGMDGPVVFVIDCEDEIGGQVARAWLGAEAVDDAIEQRQLQEASDEQEDADGEAMEETTIFVYSFPFAQCCDEVPKIFPYLGAMFDAPLTEEGVLAIVVTSGGASALTVPFSVRESS